MKTALEKAITLKNNLQSFVDLIGEEDSLSETDFEEERSFFIKNYLDQIPECLKQSRTLFDFTSLLKKVASGSGSWQVRREYIDEQFLGFFDYLEFGEKNVPKKKVEEASIQNGIINIMLQNEVFSHVRKLLEDEHYYNAVEEAYKIVRSKLKSITGKEKAHEAFKEENYLTIFGHAAKDEAEKDFFEGVKFLHMAIQKLRNEKSHKPASELEKNLAIHYIALASLAYDLINRNIND